MVDLLLLQGRRDNYFGEDRQDKHSGIQYIFLQVQRIMGAPIW